MAPRPVTILTKRPEIQHSGKLWLSLMLDQRKKCDVTGSRRFNSGVAAAWWTPWDPHMHLGKVYVGNLKLTR